MSHRKNSYQVDGFQPVKLATNVLPTKGHIIQAIHYEKVKNHLPIAIAIDKIANAIVLLWKNASLPTINIKTVKDKIEKYHKEYLSIFYGDSSRLVYRKRINDFKVLNIFTICCSLFVIFVEC